MKLTVPTPKGDIVVHVSSDPNYPGIRVLINDVQVALAEYDKTTDKHSVRVWKEEDEDYIFKQTYQPKPWSGESRAIKEVASEIELTLDSLRETEEITLTDIQIHELAKQIYSGYDYSEFNDYIADAIRKAAQNDC